MSELVEAVYLLAQTVELTGIVIFFVLFAILVFKGSTTNDELRKIRKELERIKRGD